MKRDESGSDSHREVADPERQANDVSLSTQRLDPLLESAARQRDDLQRTLAALKRERDRLRDQLDAERAACTQLMESARILSAYTKRLDETLDAVVNSKRARAGIYLGNLYKQSVPAALHPHLMRLAQLLFRVASRFVPERQLAALDLDVIQIRKEIAEACNLLRRSDRSLAETLQSKDSGSSSDDRIGNPLDIQISDDLLRRRLREFRESSRERPNKVVVYTAICNNYDILKIPEILHPDWDYVCFTDRQDIPGDHPWTLRHFDFIHADNTRTARYVKLRPHVYFPDHEFSIWIDAHILIKSHFLGSFAREFMQQEELFAAIPHPFRNCTYDEGVECVNQDKDDAAVIREQLDRYRREGFQEQAGLIEAQVLLRRHNDERVRRLDDAWWRELDRGSRRDQLSLMYVLWKNELKWTPLITNGLSTRNHEGFRFFRHGLAPDHCGTKFRIPSFLPNSIATDRRPFWMADCVPFDRGSLRALEADRIDIVICVRDALADVRRCLESLERGRLPSHRLIIVDDGSKRATRDYLDGFSRENEGVTLVRNPKTIGYTRSANRGIRAATAPFVILLNSDTIVCEGWALKLLQAARSGAEVGIVGPMSNAASWQSLPWVMDPKTDQLAINEVPGGLTIDQMDRLCERHGWFEQFPRVPLINGFCYGIKREVLDAIGPFDEETFPIGYGEEDDFSMRAVDAGFVPAVATHCYVFHAKCRSFGKSARRKLSGAGGKALRARHGAGRFERAIDTMRYQPQLQRLRVEVARACDVECREVLRTQLALPEGCEALEEKGADRRVGPDFGRPGASANPPA